MLNERNIEKKGKSKPATRTDWSRLETLFCELQDNFIKPMNSSHRKKIKSKDNRGTATAQGDRRFNDRQDLVCVYGRRRYGMCKMYKERKDHQELKCNGIDCIVII